MMSTAAAMTNAAAAPVRHVRVPEEHAQPVVHSRRADSGAKPHQNPAARATATTTGDKDPADAVAQTLDAGRGWFPVRAARR